MKNNITVKEITEQVEEASTDFEKSQTELKRKYIIWNIEVFNVLAKKVSVSKGSFGTGYPFYALDQNLEGKMPIIEEQIRYNRKLVADGKIIQHSIYRCKECLDEKYASMPDLKAFCNPCPNMLDKLKPRKMINRLTDIDMWLVCEDGKVNQAEEELTILLRINNMRTSDNSPFDTIDDMTTISNMIKQGKMPKIFLPMDVHIVEYSTLKELIEKMPETLKESKIQEIQPYLPIRPKSYRKSWQYDDEAYNYVYDFLSAFTEFNFTEDLQSKLIKSRKEVATEYSPDQLFNFLLDSATDSNVRRFGNQQLEELFKVKMNNWGNLDVEIIKDCKEQEI